MTRIKIKRIKIFIAYAGIHASTFFEQVSLHLIFIVFSTI